MSQLQEQFTRETGINPSIMNQVGYHHKYVNWLEAKVEKLTAHNSAMDATCDTIECPDCGAEFSVDCECPICKGHRLRHKRHQ